jgi:cellulose synthase/poly-beta-1,6-N-acetylglucosamine synthase-like glycosyltransferase
MALVVLILKVYLVVCAATMLLYAARHYRFTLSRLGGPQRLFHQDVIDSDLPRVSVLMPMHDEEGVARRAITALLDSEYPADRLEIIPIDDHSADRTGEILAEMALADPRIRPLVRRNGARGKQSALNDAIEAATGEVIVVFDADYIPTRGCLRDLVVAFKDPEVGAVMGRVVPFNAHRTLLTRMLDLERSAGYQVDQQARHNLRLTPQYGGTVGGFRRDLVRALGGFDPRVLAEDTDLTFRLISRGWKVVYANRVEAYEEVPESWQVRSRQIRRWSRGHNQVLFKQLVPMLRSPFLSRREKWDGVMLLGVYTVPLLLVLGMLASLTLFYLGEMELLWGMLLVPFVVAYNTFGNFAPFFQIGAATLLDGQTYRVRLLPALLFYFLLNLWNINSGFLEAVVDRFRDRHVDWHKTRRGRAGSEGW